MLCRTSRVYQLSAARELGRIDGAILGRLRVAGRAPVLKRRGMWSSTGCHNVQLLCQPWSSMSSLPDGPTLCLMLQRGDVSLLRSSP